MPHRTPDTLPDISLLRHPHIPTPLAGMAPRTILGDDWWDRERKTAYRILQYRCHACFIESEDAIYSPRLEGHECYDIDYKKGTSTYIYTVALCYACHNYIHSGRLHTLLQKEKISLTRFNRIINRGNRLLRLAKLEPANPHTDPTLYVTWSDWRLILGRKKHPPRFESKSAMHDYYAR